jgi:hypothetical protein
MQLAQGLYRAGYRESDDYSEPVAEVMIARGETVCDSDRRGLARFAGVTRTRWYVYLESAYHRTSGNGDPPEPLYVGEIYADPERSNPGYKRKSEAVEAAKQIRTHRFDDKPEPKQDENEGV